MHKFIGFMGRIKCSEANSVYEGIIRKERGNEKEKIEKKVYICVKICMWKRSIYFGMTLSK